MFSFSAIWFGLYRIYTCGVSYLFLTVVPHLRYMKAVFTSALLGLCLSKAPLTVALSNCWPFCWQGLPFLLSPHSKVLSSVEHLAHSFLPPGLSASWHHCDSHCQSLTSDCPENIASPHTPFPSLLLLDLAWSPSGNYLVIRNRPEAVLGGEAVTFHLWRPGFQGCLEVGGLCLVNTRNFSVPHSRMALASSSTLIPRRNRW